MKLLSVAKTIFCILDGNSSELKLCYSISVLLNRLPPYISPKYPLHLPNKQHAFPEGSRQHLSPISLLLTFPPPCSHFSSEEFVQSILLPAFTAINQPHIEPSSVKFYFDHRRRSGFPFDFVGNKGPGQKGLANRSVRSNSVCSLKYNKSTHFSIRRTKTQAKEERGTSWFETAS